MSFRLGVLGGMFDPVHNGHIEAAQYALNVLQLDRVKLIPCHVPNHRERATASAEQRLAMLELAIRDEASMEVDAIEIDRAGLSYTSDTLSELKSRHPDATLVFVLGADAFDGFIRWHNWQQILQLANLLILSRPGANLSEEVLRETDFARRVQESPEALFASRQGNIFLATDFVYEASSTAVRQSIVSGNADQAPLNPAVLNYIQQEGLYRTATEEGSSIEK